VPPQKIDLQQSYPCVCPRKGRLNPIALTDALGCDRCASIFTVSEDGESLIQLDSIDPFQGTWYWEGKGWHAQRSKRVKNSIGVHTIWRFVLVLSFSLLLILLLSYIPRSSFPSLIFVVVVLFVVLMLSATLLFQMHL
jgi:hypothetical protein